MVGHVIKAALLGLLLAGLFSAPAQADATSTSTPILRPVSAADDPIIAGAVAAADRYWTRLGYPPRCPAETFLYNDVSIDVNGRGDQGGCAIWIARRVESIAVGRQPRIRRWLLRILCGVVVHERGHNLGFEHGSSRIMSPEREADVVPRECRAWAESVVPRPLGVTVRTPLQSVRRSRR